MKTEIKPRIVDGEPVCSGRECPEWPICRWGVPATAVVSETCVPGLRRQRDEARAEVERLRARIRHQIETTQGAAGEDCRECLRALLAEKE